MLIQDLPGTLGHLIQKDPRTVVSVPESWVEEKHKDQIQVYLSLHPRRIQCIGYSCHPHIWWQKGDSERNKKYLDVCNRHCLQ